MNEQEAFDKLTAVIDTAVKTLNIFGINEVRVINQAIDSVKSKLDYVESLEQAIKDKNEAIERLTTIKENEHITT